MAQLYGLQAAVGGAAAHAIRDATRSHDDALRPVPVDDEAEGKRVV